jgi:hypothetical protein
MNPERRPWAGLESRLLLNKATMLDLPRRGTAARSLDRGVPDEALDRRKGAAVGARLKLAAWISPSRLAASCASPRWAAGLF